MRERVFVLFALSITWAAESAGLAWSAAANALEQIATFMEDVRLIFTWNCDSPSLK
jgi:hypothetical protein